MERLTFTGFVLRLTFALALVLATYNPSGHSYLHWFIGGLPKITAVEALAGVALLIAWVICIRATLRALGRIGLILAALAVLVIIWVLVAIDWLDLTNHAALGWLLLAMLAVVLTVGMSWSLVQRRLTGQVDVDDVDRN
jgi:predicted histidine transporter YuiF (NhaC family)